MLHTPSQFVDPYKDLNDFIPWLDPGRRISGLLDQFRVPLTTEDGEVIPFENEHAYIQDRMEGNVNYRRAYCINRWTKTSWLPVNILLATDRAEKMLHSKETQHLLSRTIKALANKTIFYRLHLFTTKEHLSSLGKPVSSMRRAMTFR